MKRIFEIIKTHFLPIAGAIGILLSVVSWIYVKGYKASDKDSGAAIVVQTQTIVLDSIKSISRQMQSVQSDLVTIKEKQIEAKDAYNSLRLLVLDIKSKEPGMTIDQFRQILESTPELKKKQFTNMIQYKQETLTSSKLK